MPLEEGFSNPRDLINVIGKLLHFHRFGSCLYLLGTSADLELYLASLVQFLCSSDIVRSDSRQPSSSFALDLFSHTAYLF